MPASSESVVQHADDAGRTLVARSLEAESLDDLCVYCRARDVHGTGMGDVGEQRSERDDERHAVRLRDLDDQLGERPPLQARFRPDKQDHVLLRVFGTGRPELVRRPSDLASQTIVQLNLGTDGLEVVELLWVDRRELLRLPTRPMMRGREGGRVPRVVPTAERGDENGVAQLERPCGFRRVEVTSLGYPATRVAGYLVREGVALVEVPLQLALDALEGVVDRLDVVPEGSGDLLVGLPVHVEPQDVALEFGQAVSHRVSDRLDLLGRDTSSAGSVIVGAMRLSPTERSPFSFA